MVYSCFNGVVDLLQLLQAAHGIPIYYVLMQWNVVARPLLCLAGTYCAWQFLRELRAIASGYPGEGDQNTCIVQCLGGNNFLGEVASSLTGMTSRPRASTVGGPGFSAFNGAGHRLGEQ